MPLGEQFERTVGEVMAAGNIRAVVLTGEGKAFSVRNVVYRGVLCYASVFVDAL